MLNRPMSERSNPGARLVELAVEGANYLHNFAVQTFPKETLHSQPYRDCPHPDCVLVRSSVPASVNGETSDGYHTFNELYAYRKAYNALLFNEWASRGLHGVHKSRFHSDGEACFGGGWFVVSAQTPAGQITNHYKDEDWALFNVPERDRAATWDGHTPADALKRLLALTCEPTRSSVPVRDSGEPQKHADKLMESLSSLTATVESVVPTLRAALAEAATEIDKRDAVLAMTVARLGGEVEGQPTHRGNFLQRIDQLVALEQQAAASPSDDGARSPQEPSVPVQPDAGVDLEPIKAREAAATKGPWWPGPHYKADVESDRGTIRANCWSAPQAIADAAFIAHARTDIPALIAEVEALRSKSLQPEAGDVGELLRFIERECHQVSVNNGWGQGRAKGLADRILEALRSASLRETAPADDLRAEITTLADAWLKAGEGWERDPAGSVVLRHGQVLRDTLKRTAIASSPAPK